MSNFDSKLIQEIIANAKRYSKENSTQELIDLFSYEWYEIQGATTPIRGDSSIWKEIKDRVIINLNSNSFIVTGTLGSITSDMLNIMHEQGYDVGKYKIPISILVAIIGKSGLEALKKQTEDGQE